jgi:hypothetical protein
MRCSISPDEPDPGFARVSKWWRTSRIRRCCCRPARHSGKHQMLGSTERISVATLSGPNTALIGERLAIGSTLLEISEPRSPCYRLALRQGEPQLVRALVVAERPGTYMRIIQPGDIGVGTQSRSSGGQSTGRNATSNNCSLCRRRWILCHALSANGAPTWAAPGAC